MYAIYMWSEYTSLKGYWTGRFKNVSSVPNYSVERVLNGSANIPVLVENIKHKSIKIYKSKENAIKAAMNMPLKVQEQVPDVLVVKSWESGYFNAWNIDVVDMNTKREVYRVLGGQRIIDRKFESWQT